MIITLGGSDLYQKIKYPGGELQVRLTELGIAEAQMTKTVTVIARIRSAEDFMELALLYNALAPYHLTVKHTILPYLPYARADRRFVPGDCHGLDVFLELLYKTWTGAGSIYALDVHSGAFGVYNTNPEPFIERAIIAVSNAGSNDINLLFPDEGARKRYTKSVLIREDRVFHATKQRDPASGKFLGFTVPTAQELGGRRTLIVDDICDGGGTFVGIAEALGGAVPLYLYVTHGIFSKGLEVLKEFKEVFTTNSFAEWQSTEFLTVYDCIPYLLSKVPA